MLHLGIIGLGNRAKDVLKTFANLFEDVKVSCVADPDREGAESRLAESGAGADDVRFYDCAEDMLAHEKPDGLMIGTRCNLHARLAVQAMEAGVPLFLEKPVFTTDADGLLLRQAYENRKAPVLVSFPLRLTALAQAAKEVIRQGRIGPIAHVSAVNNVNYGRGYYKKWYRDGSITGGMFLQKATHDLDVIFYLTDSKPLSLCAMDSRAVMGGSMPAGLRCDVCDKRFTCPESDWTLEKLYFETPQPHTCSFGSDVTIADAGSVLLEMEGGFHASYTQCFVARKGANRRLTRIVGLKGTLEIDFATETLTVYDHQSARVDHCSLASNGNHGGGDAALARSFVKLMRGEETEYPTLDDGLRSAHTCLKAQQYADRHPFEDCRW